MKAFTRIESPVLVLPEDNIDTDVLFPARYLLLMQREGLGQYFCADRRHDNSGKPVSNPIDDARMAGAGIIIAGRDFGCGSSREQAVWSLADFGVSCVIAPSFGEIFSANCLRNGVLAITLPDEQVRMLAHAGSRILTVDLVKGQIKSEDDLCIPFSVPSGTRERLLNGWDETGLIQNRWSKAIEDFEASQRAIQPWLYGERP